MRRIEFNGFCLVNFVERVDAFLEEEPPIVPVGLITSESFVGFNGQKRLPWWVTPKCVSSSVRVSEYFTKG